MKEKIIKKFTIAAFLLFMITMISTSAKAYSWNKGSEIKTTQGNVIFHAYETSDNKKAWIFSITSDQGRTGKTLNIPSKINGADVVLIKSDKASNDKKSGQYSVFGELKYEDCVGYKTKSKFSKVKTITIPDSVETIGLKAFKGSTGLEKVIIGKSVKTFEREAFLDCHKLLNIELNSQNKYFKKDKNCIYATKNNGLVLFVLDNKKDGGDYKISSKVKCITSLAYNVGSAYGNFDVPSTVTEIGCNWYQGMDAVTWKFHWKKTPKTSKKDYINEGEGYTNSYLPISHKLQVPLGYSKLYWDIAEKTNAAQYTEISEYLDGESSKNDNFEYKSNGKYAQIIHYIGSDKKVDVPEVINGAKVVDIDGNAFKTKDENGNMKFMDITEIHFPDSIKVIKAGLFSGATGLKKIYTSTALDRVEESAFNFQSSLFVLQNDITVSKYLDGNAFGTGDALNVSSTGEVSARKITLLKTAYNYDNWKTNVEEYNSYGQVSRFSWLVLES